MKENKKEIQEGDSWEEVVQNETWKNIRHHLQRVYIFMEDRQHEQGQKCMQRERHVRDQQKQSRYTLASTGRKCKTQAKDDNTSKEINRPCMRRPRENTQAERSNQPSYYATPGNTR